MATVPRPMTPQEYIDEVRATITRRRENPANGGSAPQGSVVYRGVFDASTTYRKGDLVSYDGGMYLAARDADGQTPRYVPGSQPADFRKSLDELDSEVWEVRGWIAPTDPDNPHASTVYAEGESSMLFTDFGLEGRLLINSYRAAPGTDPEIWIAADGQGNGVAYHVSSQTVTYTNEAGTVTLGTVPGPTGYEWHSPEIILVGRELTISPDFDTKVTFTVPGPAQGTYWGLVFTPSSASDTSRINNFQMIRVHEPTWTAVRPDRTYIKDAWDVFINGNQAEGDVLTWGGWSWYPAKPGA